MSGPIIGWIDGSAGASGDMLLGALIGVGVPLEVMQSEFDKLDLGIALRTEVVQRGGLAATRAHVDVPDSASTNAPARHLSDIVEMLVALDDGVAQRARATFERLAAAESSVHGISVDEVHFHEVGALDSIADVVGVCAGLVHLGLAGLHASTLALGSGRTSGAHGPIPIPAPAVLALLAGVAPVEAGPAPFESTTPTGAALLAEWVSTWGPMPPMTITALSSGAGSKDSNVVANATRLAIGCGVGGESAVQPMVQIDANVDDLDPRVWPVAIEAVMAAGAVDAWVTPVVMKKGRPAHTFSALCPMALSSAVRTSIFSNTSTIGVREYPVRREVLDRAETAVDVGGHTIRVKVSMRGGEVVNRSVEWDDVVAVAAITGRAPNDVLAAANAAAAR